MLLALSQGLTTRLFNAIYLQKKQGRGDKVNFEKIREPAWGQGYYIIVTVCCIHVCMCMHRHKLWYKQSKEEAR